MQRKLRTSVTALAVLLGVAFIAGSYVLTDTINKSFDEIFDVAYAGTDVAISSSTTAQGDNAAPPPFPERYLDEVRKVDGVEKAEGGIFSVVRFVDKDGDQLSSSFAPEFVSSTTTKPFDTLTYTAGHPPTARASSWGTRCGSPPRPGSSNTRSSASSVSATPPREARAPRS